MDWLLQNAVIATLLAAVVYLICRTRRLSPAGCHLLWLVVLVKLITPPIPLWTLPETWSTSRGAFETSGTRAPLAADPSAESEPASKRENYVVRSETLVAEVPEQPVEHSMGTMAVRPLDSAAAVDQTDLRSRLAQVAWPAFLAQVWLWGSGIVVGLMLIRIARMRRFLRWTSEAPAALTKVVEEESRRLGVRPPRVRMATHIASPQLWAVGRATLLWPESVSISSDPENWRGVIVHELAHLKRRDHWVGWLEIAANCLWWWNPVLWFVRHHLREQAELACDAWVTNAFPENRRAYADAILNVCSVHSRPAGAPAVGIANGARRFLERRIRMIFNDRVPFQRSKGLLLFVAILGLLVLPGWAQPSRKEAADPATKPPGYVVPKNDRNVDPGLKQPTGNLQPPVAHKTLRSNTPTRYSPPVGNPTKVPPRAANKSTRLRFHKNSSEPERTKPGDPNQGIGQAGPGGLYNPVRSGTKGGNPDSPGLDSGSGYLRTNSRIVATRTITLQRTTYLLPAGRHGKSNSSGT